MGRNDRHQRLLLSSYKLSALVFSLERDKHMSNCQIYGFQIWATVWRLAIEGGCIKGDGEVQSPFEG